MILDKEIEIKINSTGLKHYKGKGYDVKTGDKILIKIEDLTPSSFYKIKRNGFYSVPTEFIPSL